MVTLHLPNQSTTIGAYSIPSIDEFIFNDQLTNPGQPMYDTWNRRYIRYGDYYFSANDESLYFVDLMNYNDQGYYMFKKIYSCRNEVSLVSTDPLCDPVLDVSPQVKNEQAVISCIWKLWFGTVGTGLTDTGEVIDIVRTESEAQKDYSVHQSSVHQADDTFEEPHALKKLIAEFLNWFNMKSRGI